MKFSSDVNPYQSPQSIEDAEPEFVGDLESDAIAFAFRCGLKLFAAAVLFLVADFLFRATYVKLHSNPWPIWLDQYWHLVAAVFKGLSNLCAVVASFAASLAAGALTASAIGWVYFRFRRVQ